MTLHYLRNVFRLDAGVPDVVGVDEDDGTLFVAAGAGVAEHGGWWYVPPFHLFPERLQ